VLGRYRRSMGSRNPFTLAAANDLAIFRFRDGRHAQARSLIDETAEQFAEELGVEHPYTLLCRGNLANAMFAAGEVEAAHEIDEDNYLRLRALVSAGSPAVLAAAANLVASREATGDRDGAAQLRSDALRACLERLGTDHPYAVSLRDGERINSDIEPTET
ncbi:MAG TPA: tetratricopeptide repeat protein, partial [Micromonosporaceae bacterium]|nr:tetratricopeptide repeat protein [Micromonosporaceae bacterium]